MTDPTVYVDAERQVLSAIMHGGAEAATEHLAPSDFYSPRHAVMYDHLLELWGAGEPTDPPALLKRLADRGELTKSETAGYLHEIYALDGDPLQVGYYARIVLDGADQREASVAAVKLAKAAEISDPELRRAKTSEILAQIAASNERAAGPDSWSPIDLGPYLDGTVTRPEPTVGLARSDGLQLIYPGKEHSVIGEMESGKSWFSLACVAAELMSGNYVVYIHFEEDDPADTVDRLRSLHVPAYQIRSHFLFIGPHAPATPERIAKLAERRPSLVVLDGQNEGMILHGQEIREEGGAGEFRNLLIKPWTAVGAAVLACDHVTKDKENRGRYALGSIHKGNALNGSLIVLENAEPFGRGERGASRVYVVKDRPGHIRRHGQKTKTPGKTYLGMLTVDDTRRWHDALDLSWAPPADTTPDDEPISKLDPYREAKEAILRALADQPEQAVPSMRKLEALVREGGYQVTRGALQGPADGLVVTGRLEEVPGGRGATGYRIKAVVEPPSTDPGEQLSLPT